MDEQAEIIAVANSTRQEMSKLLEEKEQHIEVLLEVELLELVAPNISDDEAQHGMGISYDGKHDARHGGEGAGTDACKSGVRIIEKVE